MLTTIAEATQSIDALAAKSGRAKSNLSRTLRTMERYGLVRLEKGEGRKLRPVVTFVRVELDAESRRVNEAITLAFSSMLC